MGYFILETACALWESYEQRGGRKERCIKIEGSIEGLREVPFIVTCPYCETSNEIKWPMAGNFKVGRCDGEEITE